MVVMERSTAIPKPVVAVARSAADVASAIHALSDADLVRLKALARLWSRGLPGGLGWSDVLHEAIARVQARSLLIWGTRDGAVDLKSSQALMQVLPECERAVIQGAGHLPFEETPDEFNRLVLEFLERTSAS